MTPKTQLALAPKPLLWLCAALFALFVQSRSALARDVPPLTAHVNDTASMLAPNEQSDLEHTLAAYEQKTGHQFALLTIDSLDGEDLEGFSIRTVEAWKLGKKGKDDGLLLLAVKNDHKLRIEVGYGLEGSITDAFSSRVIRNLIAPALRSGRTAAAFNQAFDALMKQASGEGAPQSVPTDDDGENESGAGGLFVIIALLIVVFVGIPLSVRARRRGSRWFGFDDDSWGGGGSGSGGDSGGFSGGGGDFGGGGASGSW